MEIVHIEVHIDKSCKEFNIKKRYYPIFEDEIKTNFRVSFL